MIRLRHATVVAVLPLVAGCGLFGSDQVGPGRVQDFVAAVERVYVEAELTRDRAEAAVAALRTVATADAAPDVVAAYSELLAAVESSERQTAALEAGIDEMKDTSGPVFEHWSEDVGNISNETLRERSAQRLAAARERYTTILEAIEPALAACHKLNRDLRDHALFLGHDLNPDALAEVRAGVDRVLGTGDDVAHGIELALGAARTYLEVSSLPGSSQAAVPAAPAGESRATVDRAERQPVRLDGSRGR